MYIQSISLQSTVELGNENYYCFCLQIILFLIEEVD